MNSHDRQQNLLLIISFVLGVVCNIKTDINLCPISKARDSGAHQRVWENLKDSRGKLLFQKICILLEIGFTPKPLL